MPGILDIIMAGVDAGSQIANTVINAGQNKAQRRQAQNMFDASMAFQKYQYEDMKEYNSPDAIRQRLIQAGYNPMFTDGAGSGASPVSPASGSVPSSIPSNMNFDLAKDMLNLTQADKTEREADRLGMENDLYSIAKEDGWNPFALERNLTEETIEKLKSERGVNLTQAELNRVKKRSERIAQKFTKENIKFVKEQWKGLEWDNEHKQDFLELQKMDRQQRAQQLSNDLKKITQDIKESNSRIALNDSQRALTDQQVQLAGFDATLRKYGIKPESPIFTALAAHVLEGDCSWGDACNLIMNTADLIRRKDYTAEMTGLLNEASWLFGKGSESRANRETFLKSAQTIGDWRGIIAGALQNLDDESSRFLNGTQDPSRGTFNPTMSPRE